MVCEKAKLQSRYHFAGSHESLKGFYMHFFKIINDMNWDILGALVWNDPSVIWPTEMHEFADKKMKVC